MRRRCCLLPCSRSLWSQVRALLAPLQPALPARQCPAYAAPGLPIRTISAPLALRHAFQTKRSWLHRCDDGFLLVPQPVPSCPLPGLLMLPTCALPCAACRGNPLGGHRGALGPAHPAAAHHRLHLVRSAAQHRVSYRALSMTVDAWQLLLDVQGMAVADCFSRHACTSRLGFDYLWTRRPRGASALCGFCKWPHWPGRHPRSACKLLNPQSVCARASRCRGIYMKASREVKRFDNTTRSPVYAYVSATLKARAHRSSWRWLRPGPPLHCTGVQGTEARPR
jgi:hypothetical protein